MDRRHILDEIKRTAESNGGVPLGREAFYRETGIKQTDWYGKFWARWGDAVREAGFSPNQMQEAYSDEYLIEKLIGLMRELGHFPVHGEMKLRTRSDSEFPSHTAFSRLGSKSQLAQKILSFCEGREGYDDVALLCQPIAGSLRPAEPEDGQDTDDEIGFVYLLRSGRYYKVGKTNAAGRRERELQIQLPEKPVTVHTIRTDDPTGIEAYWHKRFDERRKNGEWFELTAADIRAFRRRKFM